MSIDSKLSTIAGVPPPAPDQISFPEPRRLRSRDVFRLVVRVWPFIRPYRRHLIYLFLLTLPGLLGSLFALNISRIFFDVVGHGDPLTPGQAWFLHLPIHADRRDVLIHACVATALVSVLILPFFGAITGYAIWILQRISNLFRVNLYTRLQELSVQFHSQEKIGDAIFRMFQDSAAIPQVINGLIVRPVIFVPAAIGTIVWLFLYDHMMALIAIGLLPANFILAWLFSGPLRRAFVEERETAALATTRIEETLASIKTVKAFGAEASEAEIYARDNWTSFVAARRARMLLAAYRVATNTVRGLAYVAALYLGALEVIAGGTAGLAHVAVSLGLFQGSISLFERVSNHTRRVTNLWGSLQDVVVAIARVLEMLARIPEQSVSIGRKIPPKHFSRLSFDGVTFGYDLRTPVLSEVSFDARAGQVTAIAGASGSGKSTIISLIVRFFEPSAGSIALDGSPICDFDLPAWRSMLSVALQENPLFTATLRDNVAYGRPDASIADVMLAIERAGLGNFLRSLPSGLETMLGEKGAKLSAGQAQRIGLARAMLRDVPILLLDEPTSALDVSTENAVMRGVRDWVADDPKRRLVVVATHRRTTAAFADRIYRIAAGHLEAAGQSAFDTAPAAEAGNA
ncbi:MAG: ABC transporter ATP-binding protein [Candidatus Binatus sp.]|uniref:ABC transporter ATP-binding protein n=1 Tax=Candidatus Binatus sp. TaxID=2811406 RepID=UPI0027203582|nr:ABC transporter ATP-binding protein [Candidatus Binatus sp.]MDO8433875.1 ABC transporter ATP-binding protein [Candidatus Binatus sp.]